MLSFIVDFGQEVDEGPIHNTALNGIRIDVKRSGHMQRFRSVNGESPVDGHAETEFSVVIVDVPKHTSGSDIVGGGSFVRVQFLLQIGS